MPEYRILAHGREVAEVSKKWIALVDTCEIRAHFRSILAWLTVFLFFLRHYRHPRRLLLR
jgi:hypothetical protein